MKAIRHTGIVVSKLDHSLHFYQDLLGFQIVKTMEESGKYIDQILGIENTRVTTVKLAADDGNLIELLFFQSPSVRSKDESKINMLGITHLAFTIDDLNAEYKRLLANDVTFISSPQVSPDGLAKVAFCRDPDGNLIELVEEL